MFRIMLQQNRHHSYKLHTDTIFSLNYFFSESFSYVMEERLSEPLSIESEFGQRSFLTALFLYLLFSVFIELLKLVQNNMFTP